MEVSVGKMQKENEAMTSQLNGLQQTCNIKEQNNEELLEELNKHNEKGNEANQRANNIHR